MTGREIDVKLPIRREADLPRRILSCQRRELVCGGIYQLLIGSLIVPGKGRIVAILRHYFRTAIQKFDDVRHMKDVLIESPEEENLVLPNGTADRAPHFAAAGCAA